MNYEFKLTIFIRTKKLKIPKNMQVFYTVLG